MFEVKIALATEAQRFLRSGMNVEAEVQVGQLHNILVVPTVAVVHPNEGTADHSPMDGSPASTVDDPINAAIKTLISSFIKCLTSKALTNGECRYHKRQSMPHRFNKEPSAA
jgi:hypothetical protein